jgi:predicted alpha-1,2-mannosidase
MPFSLNFYYKFIILIFCTCSFLSLYSQKEDVTQYVNPFIGTGGHGHTYPGATRPMGFVQLSPDCKTKEWDWCSGYHYSDTTIIGFSHTHLSGTGVGDLGDVLLMPYYGKIEYEPGDPSQLGTGYHSGFSHLEEYAKPGYYQVKLKKHGIKAELTSSTHIGFHQYTFPFASNEARIIIDLAHGIHGNVPFVSELKIENDSTITGYRYSTGWAEMKRLYFVVKFSKPFNTSGISLHNKIPKPFPIAVTKEKLKAVLTFNVSSNEKIKVRVALSANSLENAYQNLQEIQDWNFEKIKEEARTEWNTILSRILIDADKRQKEIFYTALYHNLVVPNVISDNQTFFGPDLNYHQSITKNFYSTFSLWDTFRASHPLYSLLFPERVNEFVNNFIQHHKIYGYLPIWPLWGTETHTMIGNHAISVISEAYLKGIKEYNVEDAYKAVKETSLRTHHNSYFDTLQKYGYLPNDRSTQSVSKTLEIAYNDWCVAQFAKELGHMEDYQFFLNRSQSYQNIFDSTTGFMRGKSSSGIWTVNFNPTETSYSGDYTEGNAWQYSWFVPHDIDGLIQLHGGKEKFARKLDSLFTISSKLVGDVIDVTGLIGQYAHGNEPSHHIVYLFNYAGYPCKTQYYVRKILEEMYTNKPDGLIGNEDCGQMSAWYLFSSIGFYPVNPASGKYDLGLPLFKKIKIMLPNHRELVITADKIGKEYGYVKSVYLNGKRIRSLTLNHKEIMNGGLIEFKLDKSYGK